ncbi:MAG: hypothetical protein Q6363_008180 [Candidatus Njordarchaeota archaeon]
MMYRFGKYFSFWRKNSPDSEGRLLDIAARAPFPFERYAWHVAQFMSEYLVFREKGVWEPLGKILNNAYEKNRYAICFSPVQILELRGFAKECYVSVPLLQAIFIALLYMRAVGFVRKRWGYKKIIGCRSLYEMIQDGITSMLGYRHLFLCMDDVFRVFIYKNLAAKKSADLWRLATLFSELFMAFSKAFPQSRMKCPLIDSVSLDIFVRITEIIEMIYDAKNKKPLQQSYIPIIRRFLGWTLSLPALTRRNGRAYMPITLSDLSSVKEKVLDVRKKIFANFVKYFLQYSLSEVNIEHIAKNPDTLMLLTFLRTRTLYEAGLFLGRQPHRIAVALNRHLQKYSFLYRWIRRQSKRKKFLSEFFYEFRETLRQENILL